MQLENVISVGLGTMGPGVAADYLVGGHRVTLAGRDEAKLAAARQRVEAILDFLAGENYLTAQAHQVAKANLSTAFMSQREVWQAATIVVESIGEDLALKQSFFAELEELCPPATLFLTNTSGLSVSAIFANLKQPGRALGTHYWNPPYLMPLVEVTPGEQTDQAITEGVRRMLTAMGKQTIMVQRELPGLIWNRLQFALLRECLYLLEQGAASPQEIDLAIEKGLARRASFMGLLKVADFGGGDVWYGIADYLFGSLADNKTPPAFWHDKIEAGEFGVKSGHGFYSWSEEQVAQLRTARDRYLLAKLKEDRSVQDS